MNHYNRSVRQVLIMFLFLLVSNFIISVYFHSDHYIKLWLMIAVSLFIIEIFSISYSLQIRKILLSRFGILPKISDDPFSSLYKSNQEKSWPKWNKINFYYLLAAAFLFFFWIETLLFNFDFLDLNSNFTLIPSAPLMPWLLFFSMLVISLLFVQLIILIYLWIFIQTLNENQRIMHE